jgi:hypothetical protein
MKFLKWLAALSGILAGISVFYLNYQKKVQQEQELDDYLMSSSKVQDSAQIQPDLKTMCQDILSWKGLAEQYLPVTISFGFSTLQEAENFQHEVALDGFGTSLDDELKLVDVLYQGEFTQDSLLSLAEALSSTAQSCQASYQGFHLAQ